MTAGRSVRVPVSDRDGVDGDLAVPAGANGLVIFAHGSGSSRHSPRNRAVAAGLQHEGLATFLLDLLTVDEERVDARTRHLRFDIPLLAERLDAAFAWTRAQPDTERLTVGYFGASTGAAAALVAAATRPQDIGAVVSRGGRPDLAGDHLSAVRAPTLLVVGGNDDVVIDLNRTAYAQLACVKRLDVVPGAGHLFEEPGALDAVIAAALDWFGSHLGSSRQ